MMMFMHAATGAGTAARVANRVAPSTSAVTATA